MSKLDELIKELCPNGVEYKELGEIVKSQRGKTITKELIKDGDIPVISGGQKPAYYHNESNRKGEVITVAGSGAYAGFVMYWDKPIFVSDAFSIECDKSYLNIKYIYYFLQNNQMKIYSLKKGGGVPHVYFKDMQKFLVPVPPLEVQDEIVRILDNFTALTAELTAELTARKKQYSWYIDYLLKFENKVEIIKLGNVSELKSGGTPKTENLEYWENGIIPWMSSGEVNKGNIYETEKKITKEGYENSNTKMLPKNTVVIALAGQGKTRGTVAITRIELCTNQSLCGIIPNEKLNSDYLYHYLKTQYENLRQLSSGDGTRGGLNLKMIDNYLIPLPPLEVQKRIVEVLDNFEKICNDLNIGLPAEIEARQKQYEFYRNFLLTFKIENCTLPKTRQDKTRQDIIKLFMYIFGYIELELGEIFELKNGYTPSKSNPEYWLNGNINWFKIEDINTNGRILKNSIEKVNKKGIKGKLFPENTLIISTSATIGEYALITKEFLCNQRFTCLIVKGEYKNILLPMFLKHYAYILSKKCKENIKIGNFPSVDMDKFKKFLIPLPLLEEQQRIVDILDRFDKLCNDISEGLPAEIEARQKQYEYYREKLLTFKNIND